MNYKFKQLFRKIDINGIAIATKFIKRAPRKITPTLFLLSFCQVMVQKHFSLRAWACELSSLANRTISHQAIDKKLQIRHLSFLKQVFSDLLSQCFQQDASLLRNSLSKFNRVLIEDSTCVKMADKLYQHFSGVSNAVVKKAIARIQFSFDIKNNKYENLELTTYTMNDGAYSEQIVERVRTNDLIIRDLGYWKLSCLDKIIKKGAYVLSRFKLNVIIFDLYGERFNIVKYLKKLDINKVTQFDLQVKIGNIEKLEIRLVGMKLTDKQAIKKRLAAKKSRHKDCKISKKANYLMTWNILITNVDGTVWTVQEVYNVYRLRWQIEMLFKNWKSNFKIDKIMLSCKSQNPYRPEILLYLCLIFLISIYQPKYNYYNRKVYDYCGNYLSPLKFGQFVNDKFKMLFQKSEDFLIILLSKYYCYDKRKDRINFMQFLYQDLCLG